jgi:hypothetical protein
LIAALFMALLAALLYHYNLFTMGLRWRRFHQPDDHGVVHRAVIRR